MSAGYAWGGTVAGLSTLADSLCTLRHGQGHGPLARMHR